MFSYTKKVSHGLCAAAELLFIARQHSTAMLTCDIDTGILFVRLSRSGWKQLNLSSYFVQHTVTPSFQFSQY